MDFNEWMGTYRFDWKDLNGNWWSKYELRDSKKGYSNTFRWLSIKCIIRDGYYTDRITTLYHQYNRLPDQNWFGLVEIRYIYEIVKPQF